MAAKRIALSSINWAAIAERVPPEQRPMFIAFKSKSDVYARKVMSLPERPPQIDWAIYKEKVPLPAMVDEFQKKYEAFKIPLPEDTVSSTIASQEKEAAANIQKYKQESSARIASYEAELEVYKNRIPLEEMTLEDYAYHFPNDCIDTYNRPTYAPHNPEEQLGPEDLEPQKSHH